MGELGALFGRLHPLVLHLPIGLTAALGLLELAELFWRAPLGRRALGLLCAANALAALFAAATGWVLGDSGEYDPDTLARHRNLGLAVAATCAGCALLHAASRGGRRPRWLAAYRALLLASLVLLVPAGHLGATLTHGAEFLFGPLRSAPAEPPPSEPSAVQAASEPSSDPVPAAGAPADEASFAAAIQPILLERCTACHGESKRKGKLALHDAASVQAGGSSGSAVDPLAPLESEILRRVRLPLEHEDHMPPEGKPQLAPGERLWLEAWFAAGAPFEGPFEAPSEPPAAPAAPPDADAEPAAGASAEQAGAPVDEAALALLAAERVHVERQGADSAELWIEFAARAPEVDDTFAERLLAPLAEHVVSLSLARTRVGAGTLSLAARMPRLRRLDLRDTLIGDADLAALGPHAALEELVLARTRLSDASLAVLLGLGALQHVFVWESGLSAEALARLAAARPELSVESGATPDSAVLEVEPELAFTSDRPPPQSPGAPGDPLAASNALCPVSKTPVSPKYRVVYGTRVIAFCCPECPKAFWADPEAFLSDLR